MLIFKININYFVIKRNLMLVILNNVELNL